MDDFAGKVKTTVQQPDHLTSYCLVDIDSDRRHLNGFVEEYRAGKQKEYLTLHALDCIKSSSKEARQSKLERR